MNSLGNYDFKSFSELGDCPLIQKDQQLLNFNNKYPQKASENPLDLELRPNFNLSQFNTNSSRDGIQDYQEGQYQNILQPLSPYQICWTRNPSITDINLDKEEEALNSFQDLTTKLIRNISNIENRKPEFIEIGPIQFNNREQFYESKNLNQDEKKLEQIKELSDDKPTQNLCSFSKKIHKSIREDKKLLKNNNRYNIVNMSETSNKLHIANKFKLRYEPKQKKSFKLEIDGCNNIVKNYGKAMAAFAVSNAAIPYLQSIIKQSKIKYEDFSQYIYANKESLDCIGSLRNLLLVNEDDPDHIKAFKNIFKEICLIFLKYFAVNWIYNGKMSRKRDHLNCRFYLMRRVANPNLFTYLRQKKISDIGFCYSRSQRKEEKLKKIKKKSKS